MELGRSDQPGSGSDAPSDLRRSVGEATDRIHEIIDAAERVASQIRSDAETEARSYLADRKAEADALAQDRTQALDRLTRALADTAEQFKHQAERLLADLDEVIVDARAGMYRHSAVAATGAEADPLPPLSEAPPAPPAPRAPERPEPAPLPKFDFDLEPFDAGPAPSAPAPPEPELAPEPEPERPSPVVAYPGRAAGTPSPSDDATSEALLRATQLAVTGKGRDEIADVLRADFPGVEAEALLDEILG